MIPFPTPRLVSDLLTSFSPHNHWAREVASTLQGHLYYYVSSFVPAALPNLSNLPFLPPPQPPPLPPSLPPIKAGSPLDMVGLQSYGAPIPLKSGTSDLDPVHSGSGSPSFCSVSIEQFPLASQPAPCKQAEISSV